MNTLVENGDTVKLKDAIWHDRIIGYGVSDNGDRFGGGDESAEYGLCDCHPRRPLSLRQAVQLKMEIGEDAAVMAFFDNEKFPKLVQL